MRWFHWYPMCAIHDYWITYARFTDEFTLESNPSERSYITRLSIANRCTDVHMLRQLCCLCKRLHWSAGARPTNDISIEFEIQWNFVMLLFITYPTDHKEIWHSSRQLHSYTVVTVTLSWRVHNFVVINWAYLKPGHSKFWSNFEIDRNTISGMGAWCFFTEIVYLRLGHG